MPQAEGETIKAASQTDQPWYRKLRYTEWTVIVLMVLALVGIAMTYFRPETSYRYWLVMVPLFGIACVSIEWSRARRRGQSGLGIIRDELLHWFGALVAVYLIYMMMSAGQLDNTNAGLVTILTLALATYLAGVHLGWRIHLIGAFLGAIIAMQIFFKAYIWLLVLIGLALIAAYLYFRISSTKKKPSVSGDSAPSSTGQTTSGSSTST